VFHQENPRLFNDLFFDFSRHPEFSRAACLQGCGWFWQLSIFGYEIYESDVFEFPVHHVGRCLYSSPPEGVCFLLFRRGNNLKSVRRAREKSFQGG